MEKESIITIIKSAIFGIKKYISEIPRPKFDIKTILLIVLFTISTIYVYKWYFGSNVDTSKIKDLTKRYKDIEKQKKVIDAEIIDWKSKFDELKIKDDELTRLIPKLAKDTRDAELRANKSKAELERIRLHILEIRKKIEEFKKNPSNRSGDALLESIKNQTK
jgi:peptidoglycan hydrolase CwlO-like protein